LSICDRILTIPSSWQLCLTPLIQWLTLHKEDGLSEIVLTDEVMQELARVHQLINSFVQETQKVPKNSKSDTALDK